VLDGKVALVTGAGQGIGREIALEMARQGAGAVAVADRDAGTAADAARLISGLGVEAIPLACDLRERDQIEAMVEQAVDRLGGLDVLVNNAGVIETSLTRETAVDELPEEVWDTVYEVNLKAVWLATKFAAPHLRRSARGPNVVNAASVSGLVGFARAPIYCASKGGVVQLTRATAIDLAPRVRCNCFCPGLIETPLNAQVRANSPELVKVFMDHTPLGRAGKPEDIVGPAIFLASDMSAYVTGAIVMADGGYRSI